MSAILKAYAKHMKNESLTQARAVRGKPMGYKRVRYIQDALYYRSVEQAQYHAEYKFNTDDRE